MKFNGISLTLLVLLFLDLPSSWAGHGHVGKVGLGPLDGYVARQIDQTLRDQGLTVDDCSFETAEENPVFRVEHWTLGGCLAVAANYRNWHQDKSFPGVLKARVLIKGQPAGNIELHWRATGDLPQIAARFGMVKFSAKHPILGRFINQLFNIIWGEYKSPFKLLWFEAGQLSGQLDHLEGLGMLGTILKAMTADFNKFSLEGWLQTRGDKQKKQVSVLMTAKGHLDEETLCDLRVSTTFDPFVNTPHVYDSKCDCKGINAEELPEGGDLP